MKDIKRLKRKIEVLNKTADRLLKSQDEYSWGDSSKCNCGQIALSCGVDVSSYLDNIRVKNNAGSFRAWTGLWGESIHNICSVTGKPFKDVFRLLHRNGFKEKDISNIENCSNTEVLDRIGFDLDRLLSISGRQTHRLRESPIFVAFYFYAWADILEEELEIKKALNQKHPCAEAMDELAESLNAFVTK